MKTFFNLIQEVQKPGLCHHCGGCVTFCTAINYGALELDENGRPRYSDIEKCIECGICHSICPEVAELDEEMKRQLSWSAPIGRVIETTVARAKDPEVRAHGTDGGVVTALLLHLLDMGRIDGAIVSRKVGPFRRWPWLAITRDEILEAAGFHFDTMHGMTHFSKVYSSLYSTFSPSILELGEVAKKRLNRVAFVGTPARSTRCGAWKSWASCLRGPSSTISACSAPATSISVRSSGRNWKNWAGSLGTMWPRSTSKRTS